MKKQEILSYKQIKEKIISLMKEINPNSNHINFREITDLNPSNNNNFIKYFELDKNSEKLFNEDYFYDEFNESRVGWSISIFDNSNHQIASFNLSEMPSCCKYIVAQNFVAVNNSKFEPLIELMEFFAQLLKYTCILYTNSTANHMIARIEKKNYKILECNINRRTDNEIGLYIKEIDELPFQSDYESESEFGDIF